MNTGNILKKYIAFNYATRINYTINFLPIRIRGAIKRQWPNRFAPCVI